MSLGVSGLPARALSQGRARLDLHLHSDASDGRLPAEELLAECAAAGLDLVALTDHDLPPQLPAGAHRFGGRELHLLHAAEVSGRHEDRELHLLVYFPGPMPQAFRDFLEGRVRARADRYDAMRESLGISDQVPPADEASRAGRRALTRHHLARAMVEAGVVSDVGAAFRGHLGHQHGHVPRLDVSFIDAIQRARAAGGLCSWAHPEIADAHRWAAPFAQAGLHAMECYRPQVGRHGRAVLARIALRAGLLITGGSDWHGWRPEGFGRFCFHQREARPFLRRLEALAAT